jgi:uncharacterized protein (DUF1499 family)
MGLLSGKRPRTLGVGGGRVAACPATPNCVSSQAPRADTTHYIAPIAFSGTPEEAWRALAQAMRELPRAVVVTMEAEYLHAEISSRVFGFVDDLECVLDAPARLIHVRSASRLGNSDFGVNRKRVERLRLRFRF